MARVAVLLPASLVTLFPGSARRVEVEACDVSSALDALQARWPGMRDRVVDGRPAIRQHIKLYVNDELAGLETQLSPGDELLVVPAISGGA
jgi:molybdopterin converting factor small subunit